MPIECQDFAAEFAHYVDDRPAGSATITWAATTSKLDAIASADGGASENRFSYREWTTVRGLTGSMDLLATFSFDQTPSWPDRPPWLALFARLPDPPFTLPSGGACNATQSFVGVTIGGTEDVWVLRLHNGVYTTSPANTAALPFEISAGSLFYVRLLVQVDEDDSYTLHAKAWRQDQPEPPTWLLERTKTGPGSPCFMPDGGRVAIGAATRAVTLTVHGISESLHDLSDAARIRSHVSEDAGSLFQATQAVAVESAVSVAFPYGTSVPSDPSGLATFREALTPDEVALRYYALPTRNQEMLSTVEGETNLGRMARTYPGPIVTRVVDIPGHSGETMTAQQAIQHVFGRWASEFPWFRPLPVPDLRLLVGEAVADPRQYYIDNPEAGVLTTEAIVIPQDGDNRRTMREIVDEWLSIFPGTIVRQDSQGHIELVPRVGPDAPADALTLEWRDILSMSDGEDDPRGVVNRARVESQGWEWQEDQAVVPPLYVLATRSDGLTPAAMEGVTDGLTSEPLANGGEREFEVFVEPDTPLDVDVTFSAWSASNPSGGGGLTEEVTLPLSFTVALGQTRVLEFSWFIFGVDNEKTFVHVTRTERGLQVRVVGDRYRFGPNPFAGTRYVAYLLEVTAATGTAWTRSNEAVTAEFSLANGDVVPGPDGSNALATSTALYGEREATIRSDVFQLTPEQAQAVAQGHVLFNINPRTIRDVQQSEWNAYPVKFDHVGRLVDLPNGERAVVENRSYSDSFAPNGGFMQSAFTATVSELVIDTTTEYLYLDDGNYMRLDDGQLVEAS